MIQVLCDGCGEATTAPRVVQMHGGPLAWDVDAHYCPPCFALLAGDVLRLFPTYTPDGPHQPRPAGIPH